MAKKFKLKKDDEVIVLTGKDKGRKGKITRIITDRDRVIVAGVNIAKKHKKPDRASGGGIINKEMPVHISNVALVTKEGKPTKVGFRLEGKGKDVKKLRIAKATGETVNEVK